MAMETPTAMAAISTKAFGRSLGWLLAASCLRRGETDVRWSKTGGFLRTKTLGISIHSWHEESQLSEFSK